jgi:protein-tyrosine phosphatase
LKNNERYIGLVFSKIPNPQVVKERYSVLFLCTGNYYRSRFAELLFNYLTPLSCLDWQATSRGLAIELGVNNIGPISPFTLERLALRGVQLDREIRFPLPLEEKDLAKANRIIALKQDEHLPMLQRKFPRWVERTEFWQVHDIDVADPTVALP